MKKLCALLALMFVLSFAGGVSGQNNRNRRDDRRGQDRMLTVRSKKLPVSRSQANRESNYRRHRRHRTNRGNRNNNRP